MEERNALRETLSAPVSREQASGDLLAEIADIHDMAISRDANTLYAAIENTNSIVVFDLGQRKSCIPLQPHSERKVSQTLWWL